MEHADGPGRRDRFATGMRHMRKCRENIRIGLLVVLICLGAVAQKQTEPESMISGKITTEVLPKAG